MVIKDFLTKYPNSETDDFLTFVLKKSKEFLYMNPEHKLTSYHINILSRLLKRRQSGEPMAYILGYKDFCGLRFVVNKNVLVPRPETELIVELVVNNIGGSNNPIGILDVGTGSGCIPVSIAKSLENRNQKVEISASDISPTALKVAKQNAKIHRAKIKFYKSDLLKNIKQDFDIIIANLPYGWAEWKNNTTAATVGLKFEPKNALFTKEQGLYEIRRLLEQIQAKENQPKYIFLEFDPRQKIELQKLAKRILPKYKTIFHKDFRGLWRVLEICAK